MSFTDQEPRVATDKDVNLPWSGNKANFRCPFCGHRIKEGETWQFLYTNDLPGCGGNPLVCDHCIASAKEEAARTGTTRNAVLRERWQRKCAQWHEIMDDPQWWWFRKHRRGAQCGD